MVVIVLIVGVHVASYAPVFASHRLEFVHVSTERGHTLLTLNDHGGITNNSMISPLSNSSSIFTSSKDILAQTEHEENSFTISDINLFSLDKQRQEISSWDLPPTTSLPLWDTVGDKSLSVTKDVQTFAEPVTDQDLRLDLEPSSAQAASAIKSKKILKVTFSQNRAVIHHTVDIINGAVLPVVQQALVIASAGGLAYGLKATSRVRGGGHAQRNGSEKAKGSNDVGETTRSQKSSGLSQKEVRLVKVVAFLALILTICNIPRFIAVYTTLLIPEMHIGEAYENMYVFLWALTALFASVNASVNIFVYLTVNSAYRSQFDTLFRCFRCKQDRVCGRTGG
ncbi:chemosensory receptor C [Elysia marginata]|uniref:Chemosensory receptor C n=1 Tax=Elysia marginata TaxID=1093978 RepID=A0AAV4EQP7_9GAST|nr:chemosensory receptor C [Elysia marginata]